MLKNSNRQLKAKRSHLARAHAEAGPPIGRVRAIRAMVARRIGVGEHFLVRRLVLFLVALCYLAAFASLRDQWRGLFGRNGVTPVDALLAQVQKNGGLSSLVDRIWTMPTLLWLGDTPSVDAMGEAMCSAGAVLSVTAASLALFTRGGGSSIVFGALWGMYLSLFHVGQVFLSFQWDILLLEVGFVCIWLSPKLRPTSRDPPHPAGLWLLRFICFKLMLMSGAVKIQSECPTWLGLTALDYHFDTQPLPTPLAWWASTHVPREVKRFGVAATLAIEGPLTTLLVAPFRRARTAGAYSQLLLQATIAATGNYTFFNLLTVALACSALDDASLGRLFRGRRRADPNGGETHSDDEPETPKTPVAIDHDDLPANPSARRKLIDLLSPNSRKTVDGAAQDLKEGKLLTREQISTLERAQNTPLPDFDPDSVDPKSTGIKTPRRRLFDSKSPSARRWSRRYAEERESLRDYSYAFGLVGGWLFVAFAAANALMMFKVDGAKVTLKVGVPETNAWLAFIVPCFVRYAWMFILPASCVAHCYDRVRASSSRTVGFVRIAGACFTLVAAAAMLRVVLKPLHQVVPKSTGVSVLGEFGLPAGGVEAALPSFGSRWDDVIDACSTKFRLGSGYGLFRRMTGVGDDGSVMRPEIILEGSDDGGNWTAIEFKHKPSDDVRVAPTWVAPHQPRLDWQMWFAALGAYNHNTWLINLVYRLLKGEPEVWGLVDDGSRRLERYPGGWGAYGADAGRDDGSAWAPTMIRGRRYAYRFVLADSDERTYWKKTFVDEYLPALSLDNQSLMNYVRSQTDWSKDDAGVPVDLGAALEFFRGLNNLFAYFIAGTACAALLLGLDTVAARLALETYGAEKVKRD